MEKRRIEFSPVKCQAPEINNCTIKRKKVTDNLAGDRKIAQINGNSMNGHKVNDENISDNVNRTVLEELKNLENFVFDDMDFFDEVSFCFEIAKDYWMFFSRIN